MKLPRPGLWLVLAFAPMTLSAQPAPSVAPLGSTVFKWEDLVPKPTGVGVRRDVVDRPTATLERFECHISTLNAGLMSHPPHRHPQEEFILLQEGVLEVSVNGRTQRVGPGSFFFFASNDWHNVTNVGDQPATYLVFNLATEATHHAPPEGAAVASVSGILGSTVLDWAALPVKATKTGERRELVNSPTTTCENLEGHVTTLRAGEVPHATHRHPDEELVIVKEGLMEVKINGVSSRAGPGSIFFYASNDEHGMKNVGPTEASYYVIRFVTSATPRPAT